MRLEPGRAAGHSGRQRGIVTRAGLGEALHRAVHGGQVERIAQRAPGQRIDFTQVASLRRRRIAEREGQHRRVRHPQDRRAHRARLRRGVREAVVVEAGVELVAVVDRVVDPGLLRAAVPDVGRGDAQVVDERRIVGARAERAQPPRRAPRASRVGLGAGALQRPGLDGRELVLAGRGIPAVAGDLTEE